MEYKLRNLEASAEFESKGQWRDLLDFSKEWADEEPGNPFAWQAMANSLRKLGRPEEAIPAFRKGINVAPPHPVPFMGTTMSAGPLWYGLAQAYGETGKTDLAIEAFQEAGRVDPMVVDIWNDLGVAYANNDDYQRAFDAFKKALGVEPTNINSLKNIGIVYAMGGVAEGVSKIHEMLSRLDSRAANDFLAQAEQYLSQR